MPAKAFVPYRSDAPATSRASRYATRKARRLVLLRWATRGDRGGGSKTHRGAGLRSVVDSGNCGPQSAGFRILVARQHARSNRRDRHREHLPSRTRRDVGGSECSSRAIQQPFSARHGRITQAPRGGRTRSPIQGTRRHHARVSRQDGGSTLPRGTALRDAADRDRGTGTQDARACPRQVYGCSSLLYFAGPYRHGQRNTRARQMALRRTESRV